MVIGRAGGGGGDGETRWWRPTLDFFRTNSAISTVFLYQFLLSLIHDFSPQCLFLTKTGKSTFGAWLYVHLWPFELDLLSRTGLRVPVLIT